MSKSLLFSTRLLILALVALFCVPTAALADELTVNDGTSTSSYVPACGYYNDDYTFSEVIYPASDLNLTPGSVISGIKYYASNSSASLDGTYTVSLSEVSATALTGELVDASATVCYSGAFSVSNNEWDIPFSQPYVYTGGNLLVQVKETSSGYSYSRVYFYGVNASSTLSYYFYGDGSWYGDEDISTFVPKTTFTYTAASTSCPLPTSVSISDTTTTSANVSWVSAGTESAWQVSVTGGGQTTSTVTSSIPYLLSGLTPGTTYSVSVNAICAVGDTSYARTAVFATQCATISTFPWVEDFELANTGNLALNCWQNEHIAGYATNLFQIGSLYTPTALNGAKVGALPDQAEGNVCKLTLPDFNIPAADSYEFVIDVYRGSYSSSYTKEGLKILVNNDTIGFIPREYAVESAFAPALANYGWERYFVTLPAGDVEIAILGISQYGNPTYFDNLKIRPISSCKRVEDIHFVSADLTSATFAWTGHGESAWNVQVVSGSDTTLYPVTGEPQLTLTGLTSATVYDYTLIIQSDCGSEQCEDLVKRSFSFSTECPLYAPVNDSILVGFEEYNSAAFNKLPCLDWWIANAAGSTSTSYWNWSVSTSYPHSGSKSAYCYSTSKEGAALAMSTPLLDIVDGSELSFWVREGYVSTSTDTSKDSILVYVNDSATLTNATYIGAAKAFTDTYRKYRFNLPGVRGSKYIILVGYSYNSLYIDDILVSPAPQCQPVMDAAFVGFNAEGAAVFTWNPGASETAWNFSYELTNADDATDVVSSDEFVETAPTFAVENLAPQSHYSGTVLISAVCDEENISSNATLNVNFATPCLAITSFPWSEDFSDATAGSLLDCWNNEEGTTTTASYRWNVYTQSSNNCLRFNSYSNSSNLTNVLKSPAFALPEDEILILKFDWKNPNGGNLQFYISTDGGKTLGEPVRDNMKSQSSWKTEEISLSEFKGQTITLVFKSTSNCGYSDAYHYLDNFSLVAAPSCLKPNGVQAASVTLDSVVLNFPGGQAAEYAVLLKNGTNVVYNDTVAADSVVLHGLATGTEFTLSARVVGICSETEHADTLNTTVSFTTPCVSVTQFPWSETFEDASTSSSFAKACWSNEHTKTTSSYYASYVFAATTTTYGNGSTKTCYLPDQADGNQVTLTLPTFDIPEAGAYEFRLDVYRNSYYTDAQYRMEGLYVLLNGDTLGFIPRACVASSSVADSIPSSAWQSFSFDIPAAGDNQIQIVGNSKYGNATYMDNLIVRRKPLCAGAEKLHNVGASTTTDTIAWSGSADSYTVFFFGNDTLQKNVTDTFCVLDNLQAGTYYSYNVAVAAHCAAEEAGDTLRAALAFETQCVAISSLPYDCGFESAPSGSNPIPTCWERGASYYPYVATSSYTAHSGSKYLYFYGGGATTSGRYLSTPDFTADVNTMQVAFYHMGYVNSGSTVYGRLIVGTMLAAGDSASFFPVDTLDQHSAWTLAEINLDKAPAGHKAIAFTYGAGDYNYGYYYLDDVHVNVIPTCYHAENLHFVSAGLDTAVVAWSHEDVTSFHVSVKNGASVLFEGAVNDTSLVIEGLNHSSQYALTVSVAALCSATDTAEAIVSTIAFATECENVSTFPYTENFDAVSAYALPACWDNQEGTTTYSGYKWGGYVISTDNHCVRFDSYSNGDGNSNFLKTPVFELPADAPQMASFEWKNPKGTDYSYAISTDGGATFGAYKSLAQASAWTVEELDLTAYAGQQVVFSFKGVSDYGYGDDYAYLDNLRIFAAPTCTKPADIVVGSVGLDTAVIRWTAGSATDYSVLVKKDSVVLFNGVVSADSVVLTNLSAATYYNVSVTLVGVCSAEDHSDTVRADLGISTECQVISTFPWSTSFEDAEGFVEGAYAPCFQTYEANGYDYAWSRCTYASRVHTGTNSLIATYSSVAAISTVLELPTFDFEEGATYQLKYFAYYGGYTGYGDALTVAVDDTAHHELEVVDVAAAFKDAWASHELSFVGHGQSTISFAYSTDDGYSMYLDDVTVTKIADAPVDPVDPTTGVDNVATGNVVKFIRDNQVYILRDGVIYNALGQKVAF